MLNIGVIVGSTRPGRKAAAIATWVHGLLNSRKDAEFEIVDIEDYKLPLLDETVPLRCINTARLTRKLGVRNLRLSTLTFSGSERESG
jgi:NAD(P)H-dependent FMN reductase